MNQAVGRFILPHLPTYPMNKQASVTVKKGDVVKYLTIANKVRKCKITQLGKTQFEGVLVEASGWEQVGDLVWGYVADIKEVAV